MTNLNSVGNTISTDVFNQEAESLGLFEGLGANNVMGVNLDKLRDEGGQAAFVRAKILLMAYKVGAAEGQTGQGMSNKDADRFRTIIRSSSDAATFRQSLVDYLESKIDEVDVAAASILDHPSVKGFNQMYPDSPLYGAFQKPPAREFYGKNDPERWERYTALSTGAMQSSSGAGSVVPETPAAPSIVTNLDQFNTAFSNPNVRSFDLRFETQEELDAFMAANPGAVDVNGNALRLNRITRSISRFIHGRQYIYNRGA